MKHGKNMSNIEMVGKMLKGERPFVQVGYSGDANKYIIRKVGEQWVDGKGKEWVQTESGPQSITRLLDMVRAETNDKCTTCGREVRWGTKLDQKMYRKTHKCFDCLVEEETQLKIKGEYKLYEQKKMLNNELAFLSDIRVKLKESKEYLESDDSKTLKYVNSTGMVEEWSNEVRAELTKNVKKDWILCLKKIKDAEKKLKKVEEEIASKLKK
jgi:hypothetical protein